jgi:hypothetical protein
MTTPTPIIEYLRREARDYVSRVELLTLPEEDESARAAELARREIITSFVLDGMSEEDAKILMGLIEQACSWI